MPKSVVETKIQEQSSDDTVDLEPPTATDEPEDPPSASGDNPEMPPSAGGDDLKVSPSPSGDDLKESPTGSGEDLKEPPTGSGEDLKEPPTGSGEDLKEPPTGSWEDLKEPSTGSCEDLKEPPIASSGVLKEPPIASSGDLKEPPIASSGVLKEPPIASSGDLKKPPTASGGSQKESFSVSGDESELDYAFLSTFMKNAGSFQLWESLEARNLDKEGTKEDKSVPRDTSPAVALHQQPSVDTDSSSESEDDIDPEEGKEIQEIKKKILRTKRLLRKAEDAKMVLILIEKGEPLAKEIFDDDFVFTCKSLISTIDSHIKDANALPKRLKQMPEEVDPGTPNPVKRREDRSPSREDRSPSRDPQEHAKQVPWKGLSNLKYLIKQLAATGGVTVTPEEVKDAINGSIVQAGYENFLDQKKILDNRIRDIVADLEERWVQAEEFLNHLREFAPHVTVGDVSAAKTVDELRSLCGRLLEMSSDCDTYLTMGLFHCLQLNSKLFEYVTENALLIDERNSFLKSKMNLFGPINEV